MNNQFQFVISQIHNKQKEFEVVSLLNRWRIIDTLTTTHLGFVEILRQMKNRRWEIDTERGDGGFEFDETEALPVAAWLMVGDGGSVFATPERKEDRAQEKKMKVACL